MPRRFEAVVFFVWVFSCIADGSFLFAEKPSSRVAWTTSRLRGMPTPPTPFRLELAFPHKFQNPTCVTEIPGSRELLVTHDGGKIVAFSKASPHTKPRTIADLAVLSGGDVSISHVAFHPDFPTNRFVFVCHRHHEGGWHSRLSRYTLTNDRAPVIRAGSEVVLLRWPAGGHGGGCLQFGPDGYLYVSTGDASGPSPPDARTTGQDVSDLLGAVLRLDVDQATPDRNYGIPADNPFVGQADARAEIWSYGLRNPWKFGIDRKSGDVFVADNGWETWEMIHKLHRGSNCGWPIMEGRARLRVEVALGPTPITPPIKDHPHTEANSVIGGPVYRGTALMDLDGMFLYGDYITGTIWGLRENEGGLPHHRVLVDTELHIVALAEASAGEVYVLDYDRTGQVYQLLPSDAADTSATFPRRLSETGLFSDTEGLVVAPGVLPYELTAEPWDDGAATRRWIAVPGAEAVKLAADPQRSEFPEGTVFVKHLMIGDGKRPLETQLLHLEQGRWNPYSYLWDQAGEDAVLVDGQGMDVELPTERDPASKQTWHLGATTECRLCHSAAAGPVLGFHSRQLDREVAGVHQLEQLVHRGLLREHPPATAQLAALVDPHDANASLDHRARSYLHMNCGVCHNHSGPATISFFAHRDYPFEELRITKRPGIGTFGMSSPQLVFPGQPFRSIILYRMSKLGYGRMPYVGSRIADSRGIALIAEWIHSLDASSSDGSVPADAALHSRETRDLTKSSWDKSLTSTERTLELSTAFHRSAPLAAEIAELRRRLPTIKADARGLFEPFLPEAERRRTLGARPPLELVLEQEGDARRGRLIFHSDDSRCRACHHERDERQSLGPTLVQIRKKYRQRQPLLQHILEPSLKVEDEFATWTAVRADGQVFSGLLLAENDHEVTIQLADKRRIRIDRKDLDALQRSAQSVMPQGVMSDLTPQEAADLLSYVIQDSP